MKGYLENLETGETGELQPVSILGRSAECNVLIPDPRVSRRHAMIRLQDGGFHLFDLGSFNGSYLNGVRVTAARKLESGDVINLADHEFRFNQEGGQHGSVDDENFGGSTIALIRSTPVIILVSDIVGFTELSEKLPPDELAQVIGGWYADCEQILANRGGSVDKFIGDCVLAYWTAVNPQTIKSAVLAAKELVEACNRIEEEKSDIFTSINQKFTCGLALHTGKVAYGGMSQGEFTLVGDPVNLTFRVESLTREIGKPVLATGDFIHSWPELTKHSRNLGVRQVKGRARGVEIHTITSFPEE